MEENEDKLNGFMFFRLYYDAAAALKSDAARGKFLMAICGYMFDDREPVLSDALAAMFQLVRLHLDISRKKIEAGRKGGRSKKQPREKQTESESQRIKNKENRIKNEEQGSPLPPPSPQGEGVREQEFEAFWAMYPRKRSKDRARTAWRQLQPSSDTVAAITAALTAFCARPEWKEEGGRYIPAPDRWLRERRWEEVAVASAQTIRVPSRAKENAAWMRQVLAQEALAEEEGLSGG